MEQWRGGKIRIHSFKFITLTVHKIMNFLRIYLITGHDGNLLEIASLTNFVINANTLEKDRILAYERCRQEANHWKRSFDNSRRTNKIIKVGDFVFHCSGNSHLAKLDRRFEGPFEVLQLLPNDQLEIKNLTNNRKGIIATNMVLIWPGEFTD